MVKRSWREEPLLRTHRAAAQAAARKGSANMPRQPVDRSLIELFHKAVVGLVRQEHPDLTARQMAVLLTCYLKDEPQTVRGLAKLLNISKPAVSRAIDRLSEFELIRRKTDPADKRSILIQRTARGSQFVKVLEVILKAKAV